MLHPVIIKPIIDPVICRDGSIDYTASNFIDPLVSFDGVHEFFDMQSKTLRTTIGEIYDTISRTQSVVEGFQSSVDRTGESFTLLQRTVTAQLDGMKHTIENSNQQTVIQLNGFSDRMDHLEKSIDETRNLVVESKQTMDDWIAGTQKKLTELGEQVKEIQDTLAEHADKLLQLQMTDENQQEQINAIIHDCIPKLSEDLDCTRASLTEQIQQEQARASAEEANLRKITDTIRSDFQNTDDHLLQMIKSEMQRAQGEELNLMTLIKNITGENSSDIAQLQSDLRAFSTKVEENASSIIKETSRAMNSEDSLRALVNSETARATENETSIRNDLQKAVKDLQDQMSSLSGGTVSNLSEKLDQEIQDRVNADLSQDNRLEQTKDQITNETDTKLDQLESRMATLIGTRVSEEQTARMDADSNLASLIRDLKQSTNDTVSSLREDLEREVSRSKETDVAQSEHMDQVEKTLTKAITDMQNSYSGYGEDIKKIKDAVRYLKMKSDSFDQVIDDKINRSIAALVNRIESLDNRLDGEVRRARRAESHLRSQINQLMGIEEEEIPDEAPETPNPGDGTNA